MKKEKIDFVKAIRDYNFDAAQRLYKPVWFANRMMENSEVVDATMDFVDCLLARREEIFKAERSLIPDAEIQKFAKKVELIAELHLNPFETDEQAGFWVSYCMGIRIAGMPVLDALPLVIHLFSSYEGRGFMYSYLPNSEMAIELLKEIDLTPERLILPRMVRTEEDAKDYMNHVRQMAVELRMEMVMKEYHYHDFNPLPDNCYLLSRVLLSNKMYRVWTDCLLKIEVLPLQAEFMSRIHATDDYLAILLELSARGDDFKVQQVLLLNSWIHYLIRSKEQKININPKGDENKELLKAWQESVEWQNNNIHTSAEKLLPEFISKIGAELVSELILGKNTRDGQNAYLTAEREVVKMLQESIANMIDVSQLAIRSSDISYLSFLARQYVDKGINRDKCVLLRDAILNIVEQEDFRWIPSLNENNLKMLRSISALLVKTLDVNNELDKLLNRFKVRYEGINALWMNVWSDKASKETLLICALLLTAENDDWEQQIREKLFQATSSHLITQCHCCGLDIIVEQDYQIALILAEAIADQVLPNLRDTFSMAMWDNLYEKHIALAALGIAQNSQQDELKEKIRGYRDSDWQVKKQEMLHRKMNSQVGTIEKFFLELI